MKFIDQLDIAGKKLLFRVDFNVPLDGGIITDDNRIQAALPTLRYALDKGAAIILCAHLGKPKGKIVPELSLAPVAKRTGELLGIDVPLAPDCVGETTMKMAADLKPLCWKICVFTWKKLVKLLLKGVISASLLRQWPIFM